MGGGGGLSVFVEFCTFVMVVAFPSGTLGASTASVVHTFLHSYSIGCEDCA